MAWHGYILLTFQDALCDKDGTDDKRGKIPVGLSALVSDRGKTKEFPPYAIQVRWSEDNTQCLVEAQFKQRLDKAAIIGRLIPQLGEGLGAAVNFRIFGSSEGDDWQASRADCLAYLEANAHMWSREKEGK